MQSHVSGSNTGTEAHGAAEGETSAYHSQRDDHEVAHLNSLVGANCGAETTTNECTHREACDEELRCVASSAKHALELALNSSRGPHHSIILDICHEFHAHLLLYRFFGDTFDRVARELV